MRYILSILLITFVLGLSGQDYHPLVAEGNSWSVVNWSWGWAWTDYYHIYGDTSINSTTYKKLYLTEDSTFQDIGYCEGALREDISHKEVYYITYYNNEERLLYKFGGDVGDTAQVWSYSCGSVIMQVLEVDTIVDLEDMERRRMKVSMWPGGHEEYWIEGIGSNMGLLTSFNQNCVADFNQNFLCFSKNGELQYSNPEFINCHITAINIDEKDMCNNQVMIIPNPVVGSSDITIANNEKVKTLKIFNSMGVLISDKRILKIEKGDLIPGIYTLMIEFEDGRQSSNKFIVQ